MVIRRKIQTSFAGWCSNICNVLGFRRRFLIPDNHETPCRIPGNFSYSFRCFVYGSYDCPPYTRNIFIPVNSPNFEFSANINCSVNLIRSLEKDDMWSFKARFLVSSLLSKYTNTFATKNINNAAHINVKKTYFVGNILIWMLGKESLPWWIVTTIFFCQ